MIFLPKRRLVLLWATLATSLSQAMAIEVKKIVASFYRSLLFF